MEEAIISVKIWNRFKTSRVFITNNERENKGVKTEVCNPSKIY